MKGEISRNVKELKISLNIGTKNNAEKIEINIKKQENNPAGIWHAYILSGTGTQRLCAGVMSINCCT
jgi:hypothetical protein